MKKYFNYIFIAAIFLVVSGSYPDIQFFRYVSPVLFIAIIYFGYEELKDNSKLKVLVILVLNFGIWAAFSTIWSVFPVISFVRSGYYILASLSAVLGGYLWIKKNQESPFGFLIPVNIAVILTAFISLIFPNYAWFDYPAGLILLKGFTAHPNTLGALILFTSPGAVYGFFRKNDISSSSRIAENTKIKTYERKEFFIALAILNLTILGLTYSRASILAFAIAAVIIFIYFYRLKAVTALVGLTAAALILLFSFPQLESVLSKNSDSFLGNRTIIWEPSLEAAESGGLVGLGYGVSNPEIIIEVLKKNYKYGKYEREKGNSQLALIEETGIIGLILFYLPLLYLIKNRKINRIFSGGLENAILFAFLVGFIVHSFFEGWQVGVTSPFLYVFWASAGLLAGSIVGQSSK